MSIDLSNVTPTSLSKRFHSALVSQSPEPSQLIELAVALLASVFLGPVSRDRQLLLAFEYDGTAPTASISVFNLAAEGGATLINDELKQALQEEYDGFLLQDMLCRAAREHLDLETPGWRGEHGNEGYLSFGITVDEEGLLSVQPAARVKLISGEEFRKNKLPHSPDPSIDLLLHRPAWEAAKVSDIAEVYAVVAADEFTPPELMLKLAAAILLKAVEELFPERKCTSAAFEFEGDSEATRVEMVSFDDVDDRLICNGAILGRWQPRQGTNVSLILCEAVFRYLDSRVPEWRVGPGAGGHLRLAIAWDDSGRLKVDAHGRARIWTRVDRTFTT